MSKSTAKAATKAPKAPKAPKAINRPQGRILAALAKGPLGKADLAKASGVHVNWIAEYAGVLSGEMVSDLVSGSGPKKLIPAGLACVATVNLDGVKERLYKITPAGRKALAKLEEAS